MPTRALFARLLLGAGVLCAAALALVGGVVLRAPGVIAVVLAGAVSACLAAGLAREATGPTRTPPLDAAAQAAGWTIGALLALAGTAAVAGGIVAVLLGAAGAIAALVAWLLRSSRSSRPDAGRPTPKQPPGARPVLPPRPVAAAPGHSAPSSGAARPDAGGARLTAPVSELPTAALGREWLRTSVALAGWLEPAARESLVRRRQEALDELERRDPEGFARWLAAGPLPGSDPADYVHGKAAEGRGD